MRSHACLGALAGLLAVAGCGHDTLAPQSPPPRMPPVVEETFPAPRSTRVHYGTMVWARFAEPLDPATIDARTVFLKVDALRIPIDVRWDEAGRRIVIAPLAPLAINTTHTVWLTTAIRTAAGAPLESEAWWQFRTMSVRFPLARAPAHGAANKGPWTNLLWDPTEAAAGSVSYAVYAGPDSAAVAARAFPALRETPRAILRPNPPWPPGLPVYWSITAINQTTAEAVDGPVARFDVVPGGTPVDSLDVEPSQWGYFDSSTPNNHPCFQPTLAFGEGITAALRYDLSTLPAGLEIVAARLDAGMSTGSWSLLPGGAELWAARVDWLPCLIGWPGPPFKDEEVGLLARGEALASPRVRYQGPVLTAWLQQSITRRVEVDVMPRSLRGLDWNALTGPSHLEPRLRIQYYRLPASASGTASRTRGPAG